MNRTTVTFLAAALAATLALPALGQEMPKRKSGLWEITMDSSAGAAKGGGARTISQCIDQTKDDAFRQMGQQMAGETKCTQTNMQRSPGRMSFDSSCTFGTTKTTSKMLITGDFESAYKMEIQSRYDPPLMGMAEGRTVMEAKYLGACKAGQRPGDMTMPGGMTMNVYDMMDAKKK